MSGKTLSKSGLCDWLFGLWIRINNVLFFSDHNWFCAHALPVDLRSPNALTCEAEAIQSVGKEDHAVAAEDETGLIEILCKHSMARPRRASPLASESTATDQRSKLVEKESDVARSQVRRCWLKVHVNKKQNCKKRLKSRAKSEC